MRTAIVTGVCVLAWVAACTTSRKEEPTAVGEPHHAGALPRMERVDSVEGWMRAFAALHCDALFRCPSVDTLSTDVALLAHLKSEERCIEVFERAFKAGLSEDPPFPFPELRRLEAAGRVHVDPERAQQCFDAELGCGATSAASACREVIDGEAELGERCYLTTECKGEAYCYFGPGSCPGQCKERKAPGEACEHSEECGGEGIATCRYEPDSREARCGLTEIWVASGEGELCNFAGAIAVTCPEGLWCVPDWRETASRLGICRRPIEIGGSCDLVAGAVCEQGAACDGRCKRVELVAGPDPDDSDDSLDGDSFASCDVFGGWHRNSDVEGSLCAATGDGSSGSSCDRDGLDDLVPCDPGLFCGAGDTNTCVPALAAGAQCAWDEACESRYCDDTEGAGTCLEHYCGPSF